MARVQLRIYSRPGGADIFMNIKRKDGRYGPLTAFVDTGAETSLLPASLMPILDYRLSSRGHIMVRQAGFAQHTFEVYEAYVTAFLEDQLGNQTENIDILVWFAETEEDSVIGFSGILDRAILHLDMPNLTGYLDLTA